VQLGLQSSPALEVQLAVGQAHILQRNVVDSIAYI
jgi:hypothetical protein